MRIDVHFIDRVGIAHQILAVLARRRLNVVAVEVDGSHVYIDAPDLAPRMLDGLRDALLAVQDVRSVQPSSPWTCCPAAGAASTSMRCSTRWPIR